MQKPTDRILFTATISYPWRAAFLGGESMVGADLDIRVIEVPVRALTRRARDEPVTYVTAIEVEQVERRDRFGSPSWGRSQLPGRLLLAVMRDAASSSTGPSSGSSGSTPSTDSAATR